EAPLVTLALRAHTLVIDELGEELRSSSKLVRGDTAIRDVLHQRQAEGRRTIVTTYLSIDEIAEAYGAGIARRLHERGIVIELGGGAWARPDEARALAPGTCGIRTTSTERLRGACAQFCRISICQPTRMFSIRHAVTARSWMPFARR